MRHERVRTTDWSAETGQLLQTTKSVKTNLKVQAICLYCSDLLDVSYRAGKYFQLIQKACVNHMVNVRFVFDDLVNLLTQSLRNIILSPWGNLLLMFSVHDIIRIHLVTWWAPWHWWWSWQYCVQMKQILANWLPLPVLHAQSRSQSPVLSRQFICSPPTSDNVLITVMVDWMWTVH